MLYARHPRIELRPLPPSPPDPLTCDLTGEPFAPLLGHTAPFLVYDPFTPDGHPGGWQDEPFLLRIHPTLAADPSALHQALAHHADDLHTEAEEKRAEAHLLHTLLAAILPPPSR